MKDMKDIYIFLINKIIIKRNTDEKSLISLLWGGIG